MRRRNKWIVVVVGMVALVKYFGWHKHVGEELLDLHTCPACYGQTLCSALTDDPPGPHSKIEFSGYTKFNIMKLFNIKNVYYGLYEDQQVVLKKLAHNWELHGFDSKMCEISKRLEGCNISEAMKYLVMKHNQDVHQIVTENWDLFKESDGVRCGHNQTLQYLYKSYLELDLGPYHLHHFLTMLAVNMEPLLFSSFGSSVFPRVLGSCGRTVVVEYVGPTLTHLINEPWLTRAYYAVQLLDIARQFTDNKFRFYMTDVSLDNFAVNSNGKVKIIDAENIVIVDSTERDLERSEHINDGFGCYDCLSFSFDDLCGHTSSDHNFFAVCKGMLSSSSFSQDAPEGLLHNIPQWVRQKYSALEGLVEDCASHPLSPHEMPPSHLPERRKAATALRSLLAIIIHQEMDSKEKHKV